MSNIAEEVKSGNRRRALVALRDHLTGELERTDYDGRVVAAIAKELRAVLLEIDKLPGGEEKSELDRIAESIPADELAPRRANRKSGAAASPRS